MTSSWLSLRLPAALTLAAVLTACPDDPPAPAPAETGKTTATAAPSGPATAAPSASTAPKALTGMLSEEDFKALHELREGDAPPAKGEMIDLDGSQAYLSLPKGAEPPLPAVVVVHEWWGLNQHIKHWSDRLAEAGYAALAVDLYGGKTATTPDEAMALMKAVDDAAATKILLAAYRRLADDPKVKAQKRASIGWCFGGKWSLELALAAPDLDAAVVYYGHVETSPERLTKLEAPLLAIFGNEDEGIPPKMVDTFEFGLEQAGRKKYTIKRYDAKHAFANPSSGRYDQPAATEAWGEVQTFLRSHLATP